MRTNSIITKILSNLLPAIIYIILIIAIILKSKIGYVLILVSMCLMLLFLWHEKLNFFKLWIVVMLIYSAMVLVGLDAETLAEKVHDNRLLVLLLAVVDMTAVHASKVVSIFLVLGIILFKWIVKAIKITILDKIYGPLPRVERIVKRDRKLYFHKDYHTKNIQLIYRRGRKKKILDTYTLYDEFDMHYSLEWNDEGEAIVRQYDDEAHKLVSEQRVRVPKNC